MPFKKKKRSTPEQRAARVYNIKVEDPQMRAALLRFMKATELTKKKKKR